MSSASAVRLQVESALAHRIPGALTPLPRLVRSSSSVGICAVDELLHGGLPVGAITEMIGPESSGRTSLSLSFLARMTQAGRVCAWVDVSGTLNPVSVAAAGVDLTRLLWVRCGVKDLHLGLPGRHNFTISRAYLKPPPIKKGLHGGGCGSHPRHEAKGMPAAVGGFLAAEKAASHGTESRSIAKRERPETEPASPLSFSRRPGVGTNSWSRLEQALRVTDLLLQAGGFSSIVLDMGGLRPEFYSRVPLATWFRYQKAAERSQASILLLTQHDCAKSSAELVLRFEAVNELEQAVGNTLENEATVFSGIEYRVEAVRQRFSVSQSNVVTLRKPPQRANSARWESRMTWAGCR